MILDWLQKHIEDNRSFWHFRNTKVETRGKESTIFHSISPRLAKICPRGFGWTIGTGCFAESPLWKTEDFIVYVFRQFKTIDSQMPRPKSSSFFFQIVFYRYKLIGCELGWRKQMGVFGVRHLWKWIKKEFKVVLFGLSWIQGSNGKKITSSKLQRIVCNRWESAPRYLLPMILKLHIQLVYIGYRNF